jgi:hypothetical protein
MASGDIALIGAGTIVFFLWCAFGPLDRHRQTALWAPERIVTQQEDPRPVLWALGAAALGIALLTIGIIGMIAPRNAAVVVARAVPPIDRLTLERNSAAAAGVLVGHPRARDRQKTGSEPIGNLAEPQIETGRLDLIGIE